jgi:hypothetical protein
MLDIRATTGTPGAVLVNANLSTIALNDGSPVAGVPISDKARLILWGSNSLIANTIATTRLISQDLIDPINGEVMPLGTTSLQNQAYKFTNVPYRTGARTIGQGTNTAQTATSTGFTLDYYDPSTPNSGKVIGGSMGLERVSPNQIVIPQICAADTALTWTTTGLAPATQIPNGRYALLGAFASLMTEPHCVRFSHADFGAFKPGFPLVGQGNSAILGFQKGMKDYLATSQGVQFVALSEITNKPCIPTFSVSNAGTGLVIESLAGTATDTPTYSLVLAKIG